MSSKLYIIAVCAMKMYNFNRFKKRDKLLFFQFIWKTCSWHQYPPDKSLFFCKYVTIRINHPLSCLKLGAYWTTLSLQYSVSVKSSWKQMIHDLNHRLWMIIKAHFYVWSTAKTNDCYCTCNHTDSRALF